MKGEPGKQGIGTGERKGKIDDDEWMAGATRWRPSGGTGVAAVEEGGCTVKQGLVVALNRILDKCPESAMLKKNKGN